MKTLTFAVLFLALCGATAANAVSFVDVDGTVDRVWSSPSGILFLKVIQPDGSKAAGDCMLSDAIRYECEHASEGEPAAGLLRCESGECTWINLDVTSPGDPNGGACGGANGE